MDFGIILFEAFVYTVVLLASVAFLFVSKRLANRRLFDFTLVILSVSLAMIFLLVFQVHYLISKVEYLSNRSLFLVGQFFSLGYAVFSLLGIFFLNRYLLRVPERPQSRTWFRVNAFTFAALLVFSATVFASNLIFPAGLRADAETDFDTVSTFLELLWLVVIFSISWKKLELRAVRGFRRDLMVFIGFVVVLEVAFYFIPDSAFEPLNMSRYLIDTSVSYIVFIAISLRYLSHEWKFRPQAGIVSSRHSYLEVLDLSPREREVVQCLLKGKSNQEIAESLFISLSTVKTHLHRILDKTGQPSRTSLVAHIARLDTGTEASSPGE